MSEWVRGFEVITDAAAQRHVEGRVLPLLKYAWEWREIKSPWKLTVHNIRPFDAPPHP